MKIRAGAFNRDMTEALGINIKLIHAVVFALGVGLAAVAGMIASPISSVYPNMGSQVSHHVLCGCRYWWYWLGAGCADFSFAGRLGRYLWQSFTAFRVWHVGLYADGCRVAVET